MAPLHEANAVQFVGEALPDGTRVYGGNAEWEWGIQNVTFGGFSVSVILNAAMAYQSTESPQHPDPVQMNVHFLRGISPGPLKVSIRTIRPGKQFDNLYAELYQHDQLKLTSQLIFGDLSPIESTEDENGLTYPELFTPICPLRVHPSKALKYPQHWAQNFQSRFSWAFDPSFEEQMHRKTRDEDGMKWLAWITLEKGQPIIASTIGVMADITTNPWVLLPKDAQDGKDPYKWWCPSLSMSIEFKRKLPLDSQFSSTTLGVSSFKRHIQNGRWNDSLELWTAPCAIGENVEKDDKWREKMVCVAVASQVALMVSPEKNARHAKKSKL